MSIPPVANQTQAENSSRELTPTQKFIQNLPRNASLSFATVPIERLAVDRILFLLNHPEGEAAPYLNAVQNLGIKKLFAGSGSRIAYVLGGNLASVKGIEVFGADFQGLFVTSVFKNAVLPLSLLSNARQNQMSWDQTRMFLQKGCLDLGCHGSFFWRNLLSNYCLIPGFYVEKQCYKAFGDERAILATLMGLSVSGSISGVMNTALKPFYTGKFPPQVRRSVAKGLPSLVPVIFRETISHSLIFASSSAAVRAKLGENNA